MREFWRYSLRGSGIVFCQILALHLFAKFDQTTSPVVDANKFGGMSDAETKQLDLDIKKMQNAYLEQIYQNIKKFDDGNKSSNDPNGGNVRYGGAGEAHMQKGDAMISHEGGANLLELAVEKGALGNTVLFGDDRVKAEQKVLDARCTPNKDANGKPDGTCKNTSTGQNQKENKDISAALYDAGPAHPEAGSPNGGADDDHRVYVVKKEVRTNVKEAGKTYGQMILRDATLEAGKQGNIDLIHKAYSKLEQDKYIMMATDAFAFRAARLEGADTSDRNKKNIIGEYKQLAIDAYAKHAGDIKAAEDDIKNILAERIAEKKVVNYAHICADGKIKKNDDCTGVDPGGDVDSADDAAAKVLAKLNTSADGIKKTAIKNALISAGLFKSDGTLDPSAGSSKPKLADAMSKLDLGTLSGVADASTLSALYTEAKQNLNSTETKRLAEYKTRLGASGNDCLSFTTFCYSSGLGKPLDPKESTPAAGLSAADKKSLIEKDEFKKITGNTVGNYFKDTRELIFNNFAYAYNRPLAEWKSIVKMADFDTNTDNTIKNNTKTYAEFTGMYQKAMDAATDIQQNADSNFKDRLKSGGATAQQLSQVQQNYSVNFNASQKSMMQLFGQDKSRDAVMMNWRNNPNKNINPYYRNPAAGKNIPPAAPPATTNMPSSI